MGSFDTTVRRRLLELSKIEGRIAEVQGLIHFMPEDMTEFQKEIRRYTGLIQKQALRKQKIELKIDECNRLSTIEQERLDKAEKLLRLTKDTAVFNGAKRSENMSRRVLKQMESVIAYHREKIAELETVMQELTEKKDAVSGKFEQGRKSMELGHSNLQKELETLRVEEKQLRLQTEKQLLQLFDPISSRNIRPVVIEAETSRCPACSGELPDRSLQELMEGEILSCPNCQRLMVAFVPEPKTAEEPTT